MTNYPSAKCYFNKSHILLHVFSLPFRLLYLTMRYFLALFLLINVHAWAQTPINIAAQPALSYTETFSDIANWTFNTSNDGSFTAGTGAGAWKGIINGGTGTIPTAVNLTTRTTSFSSSTTGGVQKGTQSIVLLATGASDNTTSAGIDFYLNFSTVNAGTLSFDWASVNNSTGDRKGSLKLYTSTDGITFSPLTTADVLNITNNVTTSGSISNVILPASFNNVSTARIRLYYYNGSGGTTGSRPKISIDNFKVTGVPAVSCTAPSANPTALVFNTLSNTTLSASFTAPVAAPQNYIVVQSNFSSLSAPPQNGTTYAAGDNIGDGTVISIASSTSFTATALNPLSTYYFYIFSVNNLCSGGPLYLATNPLTGNATTLAGTANCTAPAAQPVTLSFPSVSSNTIQGSFIASAADEYLVVRSTAATLSANPVNGTTYNTGDALGNGIVISRNAATAFSTSGLTSATTYYFTIFALNAQNCNNGPAYLITNPLKGNVATSAISACTVPAAQPANLSIAPNNTSVTGSFSPSATADSYLILYNTTGTLSALPQNATTYSAGTAIGNATVGAVTNTTAFTINGLSASTTYYLFVFAANTTCTGGPKYYTTTPLTATTATTAAAQYNYYFGNLHAHSYYSDGNKDLVNATPASDFTYAKNSLCFDFLGISEHNHAGAGMTLSKWQPGLAQAAAATTSNFLGLYGMEWGVISGGGHVIVYGQDKLMGWETNNYDVFVPKSDYTGTPSTTGTTGLFRTINTISPSAFATLAHPATSDFNNLTSIAYNSTADSAIVGVALESGPAFSASTTYNDPSSITFLSYYTKLLSKGYKLGPTIDHDNHNTTFGRTTYARLAVIAPSLDTTAFYKAMKNMHFYATEDCDTRIMLTVNNQLMGSSLAGANAPAISITASDPTTPAATPSIKLMSGVPGSGSSPVQIASASASALTYSDNSLAANGTAYYYADITINGVRSITSPVWYTKANTTFYCKSSGSLSAPDSWGTNADGSGIMPADFSTGTFVLANRAVYSLTAHLNIGGTLSVPTGAALSLNSFTLTIASITGTGTLSGTANSTVVVAGTSGGSAGTLYFDAGNPSLGNLTISRSGSAAAVSLGSPLNLYGTLTLTGGNLITNNLLTLKSTAAGTARLAPVTGGTLAGNVTVERYITAIGHRSWRLVGVPAAGSQTIYQAWQDTARNRPDIGTLLTSDIYNGTNGFDTISTRPSLLTHLQGGSTAASWVPVTNTNSTILAAKPGYLVFVRGDRSAKATNNIINPTVLRTTGTLRTGTQPSIAVSALGTGYTLVCNPFPSPIDAETFLNTPNLTSSYYLWDPTISGSYGVGAFRLVTRLGPGNYEATPTTPGEQSLRYIQSGACLFLRAFGASASLTLAENNKTTAIPTVTILKPQATTAQLHINLMPAATDTTVLDGVRIGFDSAFSNAVTSADAYKMDNLNETVAIAVHDTLLALNRRFFIAADDTIPLHVTRLSVKNYRFSITADNMQPNVAILLHDRFTGYAIPIDVTTTNTLPFSMTADPAAAATNRFYLTFKVLATLAAHKVQLKAYRSNDKIQLEWNTIPHGVKTVEVQKATDGQTFKTIAIVGRASVKDFADIRPNLTGNYYRLLITGNNGDKYYSNTAAVNYVQPPCTLLVNAAIAGQTLTVGMLAQPKGRYSYTLVTHAGQVVTGGSFYHNGQTTIQAIPLPVIARGLYLLKMVWPDNHAVTTKAINP